MTLACVRCKYKKIKCDKKEPTCHQCIAAKSDCQYVERRKRARVTHNKAEVQHLSQRLESLEKQLVSEQQRVPAAASSTPSVEVRSSVSVAPSTDSSRTAFGQELCGTLTNNLVQENGCESWIYRMATNARGSFLNADKESPVHAGNAMSVLDEAIDDLGKLKVRPVGGQPAKLELSSTTSKDCIDTFIHMFATMFMVDVFGKNGFPGVDTLYALPDLISSPYVTLDPGLHVLYYNAMFYGLYQSRGPGDVNTQASYRKMLDSVPAWLASPSEKDLDGWTSTLSTWTAIFNFDYQLSWRFHCKSVRFIRSRGIDRLDEVPALTREEETKRNELRPLYWHVLWCDSFFRLFYGQRSTMQYSPTAVKPPDVFETGHMRPKALLVLHTAIFIQTTAMSAEILHFIDTASPEEREKDEARKVDDFCSATEALMADWNLENQVKWDGTPALMRQAMADCALCLSSVIIGVRRCIRRQHQEPPVDPITLRHARKVVDIVLDCAAPFLTNQAQELVSMHFISFYPFCAVVSLYEHIIACNNAQDCENDLKSLETLGSVMTQASSLRLDFTSMAKTINALNKVSRTFQNQRMGVTPHNPPPQPDLVSSTSSRGDLPTPTSPGLQFAAPQMAGLSDFTGDGYLEALDFVRSLESDFLERNWHEDWWNINGET